MEGKKIEHALLTKLFVNILKINERNIKTTIDEEGKNKYIADD